MPMRPVRSLRRPNALRRCSGGRPTIYPPRGQFQIVAEALEPVGWGALQLAYEQLKARLAQEGLFDEERKRPILLFPRRIGVVTSPVGAIS